MIASSEFAGVVFCPEHIIVVTPIYDTDYYDASHCFKVKFAFGVAHEFGSNDAKTAKQMRLDFVAKYCKQG